MIIINSNKYIYILLYILQKIISLKDSLDEIKNVEQLNINKYNDSINNINSKRVKIEDDIKNENMKIIDLNNQLKSLEDRIKQANDKKQENSKIINELDIENNKVNQQLSVIINTNNQLKEENRNIELNINSHQHNIDNNIKNVIKERKKEIENKDKCLLELYNSIKRNHNTYNELKFKYDEKMNKYETLIKKQSDLSYVSCENIILAFSTLDEQKQSTKSIIEELEKEKVDLCNEIKLLSDENEKKEKNKYNEKEIENRIKELEKKKKNNIADIEDIEKIIEKEKLSIEEYKDKYKILKEDYEKKEKNKHKKILEDLKKKYENEKKGAKCRMFEMKEKELYI